VTDGREPRPTDNDAGNTDHETDPLSQRAEAVALLAGFLEDELTSLGRRAQIAEAASIVKGLFTRSFKQDQWDWFLVFTLLGSPSRSISIRLATVLGDLGRGLRSFDDALVLRSRQVLLESECPRYLGAYQAGGTSLESGYGFVYILSTREQSDLLKIGYTTRSVEERVIEINRATGVIVPFGARGVWRVRDARGVEREVHVALQEYRIRADREFFRLQVSAATRIIDKIVREKKLEP
jgi:hypothetical protein